MMLYSSQWFTQSLAEVCSSRPSEGVVRGGCANLATFAAIKAYQEYNEQQQRMVSNSPCYDTPTS